MTKEQWSKMRSIDEWLIFFIENDLEATELAKMIYDRDLVIKRLQKENNKLRMEITRLAEELEESEECEDPVIRAHKNIGKLVTEIYDPSQYLKRKVEREHREGIPFEDEVI